jgi:two-component system, cell cycle response regulator DivK
MLRTFVTCNGFLMGRVSKNIVSAVLLIDDSKFLRRANELSLAKAGHQVIAASDGEEGLRLAREKKPDVIVLDMLLPKLGGAELLQLLKGDPLTAKIPVIVLSSLPQKNEMKLMADGAAAYMEKSSLSLEKCSSELSRMIAKVLRSVPAT